MGTILNKRSLERVSLLTVASSEAEAAKNKYALRLLSSLNNQTITKFNLKTFDK